MKKFPFLLSLMMFILSINGFAQFIYYPNDPNFKDQTYLNNEYNHMEDIGYLEYYYYFQTHRKEILDKYVSIKGKLPVVAIVDLDYYIQDNDLKNKVWTNEGEIADNGKDDDGNGWVDDYKVMNFIDKKVYRTSGGRSGINETIGGMLYGTQYPPVDKFYRNPEWHGQYMALLAGAEQDNKNGWHGIVPNEVKMLLCTIGHKQVTPEGDALLWIAVRDAFNYILDMKAKGVNIVAVNLSLGGGFDKSNFLGYDITFGKGAFDASLKQLDAAGIVYVVAAGNAGHNIDLQPTYPASFVLPNGIVVGAAANYNAIRANFSGCLPYYCGSNYGMNTVDIFTIAEKNTSMLEYGILERSDVTKDSNSTSSATAITTGIFTVASLLYPECSPVQVKRLLLDSYMDRSELIGLTKSYDGMPHDGITKMSGEGKNALDYQIGLITKDPEKNEKNYHLNITLRKKICGK